MLFAPFRNTSIRTRLLTAVALLVGGLLYFAVGQMAERIAAARALSTVETLSAVAVRASALIHELQKERGLSAGFLASRGQRFDTELGAQHTLTDRYAAELRDRLAGLAAGFGDPSFAVALGEARAELDRLADMRAKVRALETDGAASFAYYTAAIDRHLALITATHRLSDQQSVSQALLGYLMFIHAKEQAGRERATLNAAFSADAFDAALYRRFIAIVAAQDTYLAAFRDFGGDDARALFQRQQDSVEAREVARMRAVALERAASGGFGIEPAAWFAAITRKIDGMKEVEDLLSAELDARLAALSAEVRAGLWVAGALTAASLLLALWFGLTVRGILASLRGAVQAAERIAGGDLRVRIEVDRQDEAGQLLLSMKHIVERLSRTIGEIRAAADQLTDAATQVSGTAQSLSQSASEQAASVEETSAGIEQISAAIDHASENARTTGEIAGLTAHEANAGGEAVRETVTAMQQIAARTGVVDDIAYQTNLLALNAAIEAARAGAHGKSFAVVAAEVRKLAERAQVAAHEIAELTGHSVNTAESAGGMLEKIVPDVRRTAELVREIAASSAEQASGIGQINTAMSQLSEASQHNASASEQLAATATQMGGQARRLHELLEYFHIAGEAQPSPAAASMARAR
ncbi:methyl-accepting chemotaxis protein [Pseudothauera nasutitermitis]|nr:methyl-accepting chemotaxis protein [Pseudothauera nasutitermitis]